MFFDFFELRAVNQWPHLSCRIKGVSYSNFLCTLNQAFYKLIVYGALNKKTRASIAALSVKAENHESNCINGSFNVCIIKYNDRTFTA